MCGWHIAHSQTFGRKRKAAGFTPHNRLFQSFEFTADEGNHELAQDKSEKSDGPYRSKAKYERDFHGMRLLRSCAFTKYHHFFTLRFVFFSVDVEFLSQQHEVQKYTFNSKHFIAHEKSPVPFIEYRTSEYCTGTNRNGVV